MALLWQDAENPLMLCLKIPSMLPVVQWVQVLVFSVITAVGDFAHRLVGWTMKDPGRPDLCPEADRIAAWWPKFWKHRECLPPVEVFLTHHICNWRNLRSRC